LPDDDSIDAGSGEESEEVPGSDDRSGSTSEPASSPSDEIEGHDSEREPNFNLFTQAELDEQIQIQQEIEKSTPSHLFPEPDSDPKPIVIEKEAIQDPQLLDQLMTEAAEREDSGSARTSNLLKQDDIDTLLAAQQNAGPHKISEAEKEKLDDYLKIPRPPILKESIEDSDLHRHLLTDSADSTESKESSSPALASQDEVDAFIREEMMMAQAADAIMKEDSEISPPESDEDMKDHGLLGQDEIDNLLKLKSESTEKKPSRKVFTKPIDTDVWPEGYSEVEEDRGLLDQDELDKLLNPDTKPEDTSDASIEELATEEESLDQSDIDALLAEQGGAPEEASAPDEGTLDQSDIDSLLAEQGGAPEEASAPEEESLDQSDIDALLAEQGGAPEEASAPDEGTLDQSDIDSLLAEHSGASEEASAPEEESLDQSDIDSLLAEHGGASEEASAPEEGTLDQSDLDALLAAHEGKTEEKSADAPADEASLDQSEIDAMVAGADDKSDAEPAKVAVEDGTLDQSDIDALLAAHSGETEEEPADVVSEEPPEVAAEEASLDQSEIDSELAKLSEGDPESLLNDGDSEEALVDQGMEDRLDGEDNEEAVISVDAEDEVTEVTEAVPADGVDEEDAPEEIVTEEVSEELPEEEATVAAENAAAGSVESQSVDHSGGPSESEPIEEEVFIGGDEMTEDRSPDSGKLLPFPNLSSVFEGQGTRLITGIAAGLIVAISSFSYLMTNRIQSFGSLQSSQVSQSDTLQRAVTLARDLMEDGSYEAAYKRLREGIERSPQSVYRIDAEYLMLEADYHMQPDRMGLADADRMHTRIDHVIEKGPMHPDRTQALFLKGKVYEKQGNVLAARSEYRNILFNDPTTDFADEVLFALGELELNTDRPRRAANFLQQLRREHPTSTKAGDAQILLGDAYADLGDDEQARKMYIEVAEAHLNDKTGALAFERLGNLDFKSGDFDNAIRELENRLENATTVEGIDRVTLLLAKTYRVVERFEKARDTLNGLIDFFPESPVTPLAYIELAKVQKDLDMEREGVRTATQTALRYPDNAEVLVETGQILADFGESLEAAETWVAAHEAGAENPELLLNAGRLFAEEEQYDQATKTLQTLVRDFPRSSQSIMGSIEMAKVNFAQGRLTEAADQLESLALITTNQAQKMAVLQSTSDLYAKLELWERVAAAQGAITSMTHEPEQLAKSAVALYQADHLDEGLALEKRIDLSKLTPSTQYEYMNAHGSALMRIEPDRGLEWLETAHESQPASRTPQGIQKLLDVNLSRGKSARARALVTELMQEALSLNDPMKKIQAQQAATRWGDFLFERRDYRAAVDAYGMALNVENETINGLTPYADPVTDEQKWSMYQRANALFKLGNYKECLALYDQVASTNSPWSNESSIKAASTRLEQRRRGDVDTVARDAG
jgi:tetratricopeptide (TPR) repeat protein